MDSTGYNLSDIAAVTDGRDGFGSGNGWWVIIFLIFAFMGFGRGWNNNGEQPATNGDVQRGFDTSAIIGKLDGISNGLCDGFYAQNTTMLNGFGGLQRDLCQGFAAVNAGINQARFDIQQCCCETNRNIDAVRYENARNTCDIVNAIKEDGAATRALITQNEIQTLRDQLQTANFQLSQQAQNATLIATLRPTPIPAYQTCSPYESALMYNRSGCGCGC